MIDLNIVSVSVGVRSVHFLVNVLEKLLIFLSKKSKNPVLQFLQRDPLGKLLCFVAGYALLQTYCATISQYCATYFRIGPSFPCLIGSQTVFCFLLFSPLENLSSGIKQVNARRKCHIIGAFAKQSNTLKPINREVGLFFF